MPDQMPQLVSGMFRRHNPAIAPKSTNNTACAIESIRRMRGGAQSYLMRCSDRCHYVVKLKNNPQHRRVLVNDYIGSRLAAILGLPVAGTAVINVDPLLASQMHIRDTQTLANKEAAEPGPSFGSRYVIQPSEGPIFDYVPRQMIHRIRNLRHFAGILAFDKWTNNVDMRQAVYWRYSRQRLLTATFIDQGFCFNADQWNFSDAPLKGVYPLNEVYAGIRGWGDFEPWISRIEEFPELRIWDVLREVPPEWYEGSEGQLAEMLYRLARRTTRVRELIWQFATSSRNPFPEWNRSSN